MDMAEHDFDDIINAQTGIFGDDCAGLCGSAMSAFQKPRQEATPAGMNYTAHCENGHPHQITVEWPEFVAVKHMISPDLAYQGVSVLQKPIPWGFDKNQQAWFPDMKCSTCHWPYRLMISLGEIESALRMAIGKGFLPEQNYQQLAQHCMMMKQRMQGR